jgi:hypothetical protein
MAGPSERRRPHGSVDERRPDVGRELGEGERALGHLLRPLDHEDSVGLALQVVLESLPPAKRLAFVLSLVEAATLLAAKRGDPKRIEGTSDPDNPDSKLDETGALLPGAHATLAGPTFEEWLDSTS